MAKKCQNEKRTLPDSYSPLPIQIASIRIAAAEVISRIQAPSGQAPSLAPLAIALWEIAGGSERLGMTKPDASMGMAWSNTVPYCSTQ